MKTLAKLFILFFLAFNLSNCKTAKSEQKPSSNFPKDIIRPYAFGKNDFPEKRKEVNDFEFIFKVDEIENLTKIIRDYERKTTNQIAIVSISSTGKYKDFDKYAIDLSNYWGVGQKNKDNGLTIVFSKKLRRIRISTGNGTEKILTDKICKTIIDQIIIPEFKTGNYYEGIQKGLVALIAKWK
ncbi:TPM domain-containing protein [Polaribacter batillariae]|uniref:TPM domain-containing protein n=1 Tax=Polaribacter batillariae TaxID=2808900 RepID=A0ABX7SQV7_9FLAO|nr:TPM domain-containing protein [Polaribacter batillariae]QTD36237.1 TPM domain-containing protein [Polaribacter batillariae]